MTTPPEESRTPGDDRAIKDPLSSPALGTGLDRLARPCPSTLRPADPTPPTNGPPIVVALSGGGFRATLAGVGVIRFLADAGVLANLRYASSVSGGSIANGVLARRWGELRAADYSPAAVDKLIVDPILNAVTGSSMKNELLRNLWRAVGGTSRTDVLARVLDHRFFAGARLEDLDTECRWVFNAANLSTGVRFAFERDVFGDYVLGLQPTAGTDRSVAAAVAASAAVPGIFPPMKVPAASFPCPVSGDAQLLDGGAYDNLGLEAFDSARYRHAFLVALNAGGVFVTGRARGIPFVRDLSRANSLLYRQSTALRTRWMVDRFAAAERAQRHNQEPPSWGRDGVLFALATEIKGEAADQWRLRHLEHRTWQGRDLAFVPTVFDRLDPALCRLLVYRGWWLTGATLSRYHPQLIPDRDLVPPATP